MKTILVSKDSKGKFREIEFNLIKIDSSEATYYVITRKSGLVEGKLIEQPDIEIRVGKVKRTVEEQALLQFNSLIKHQLDKGYKDFSTINAELTQESLAKVFTSNATDQNGISKPMLCKVYDKNDSKNLNKCWYISRKHDGVRCFLYYKDGQVKTSSRGGQDYNTASLNIIKDKFIVKYFEEHPNTILDGELYRHGWTLSKISGLCRLENNVPDHEELKFYCYDIADENLIFSDRLKELTNIANDIAINNIETKLTIVEHILIKNMDEIFEYHDKFIEEGYEGAVIRDANEKYKFGARDRRMQKIKLFTDDEFEIVDLVEGLREEDMCFLMRTKDGNEFKAKPIGSRELKQQYRSSAKNLIGKFGTVKYFGYTSTDNPVPNLPVFKCLRDEKDL